MDRLNIRTKNRKFETAKDLYGIFFEDINRAGDGGIYPEMIRNRCFEDSLLPEGYTQQADGVHVVTDSGWEDEFNGGEGLSSWVEEEQIEKTSVPGWYAQDARMRESARRSPEVTTEEPCSRHFPLWLRIRIRRRRNISFL